MAVPVVALESHAGADAALLDDCWPTPATFIFEPHKNNAPAGWLQQAIELLPDDLRRDHFGLLTSGSTGQPKLVIGTRSRAEREVEVLHRAQHSEPVEETLIALPLSYSFAFVNQWLWSRVFGRRLVPTDGFRQPDVFLSELRRSANAMLCLVGSQLPLLDAFAGDEAFPGVIRIHFAGGRFPAEALPRLRERFPSSTIYNNYGCAEALPRLTLRQAEDGERAEDVGRPIDGVELRSDDDGRLLFRSAYGAVAVIEGDSLTRIAPEDWVPTGDLGAEDERGHWILAGRDGSVFKRHGEKVSPDSIVAAMSRAFSGVTVTYRETDPAGEPGLVAVVSPNPSTSELNGILRELRSSFSRAQWPLRIEAVAALPLLPNGKPDVRAAAELPDRIELWRQRIG